MSAALRLMLCGFPKSGTTTIHHAMKMAGLRSAHHRREKKGPHLADLMWSDYMAGNDPMRRLYGVEAVTECVRTERDRDCWPCLDIGFLRAVRQYHRQALLVLQTRRIPELIDSITRWKDLRSRIIRADLPGLPPGAGASDGELADWIDAHYERVRGAFAGDSRFMELAIEDPHAPWELSQALGVRLPWWGVKRANQPTETVT